MKNSRFKSKKTAIIGAGITGLYLAWKLAAKGHQAAVFEKKSRIGKEACSGLFSERILDFIPQSRSLIQNRVKSVLIHFPKKTVSVEFKKTFLVMSHAALDRLVADLAQKAGAEIFLGCDMTIHSVLPTRLSLRSDSPHPNPSIHSHITSFLESDIIIGCDGANSAVRKSLGLGEPNFRLGVQGFVSQEDHSDFVETWAVKNGFIWRIPRGQETEYGIIAGFMEAKGFFDEFLAKRNIKLNRVSAAPIPQGLVIPKNDSITLCGDAAGLTKPWSGGGVVWGLTAANLLLKNFPDFVKYEQKLKRRFWLEIAFSKIAVKMVYFFGFKLPYFLPKNVKIDGDFLI